MVVEVKNLFEDPQLGQREQQNLKTVQAVISTFHQGNLQAIPTFFTDDIEVQGCAPEELPIGGQFIGPQELIRYSENHKKLMTVEWEQHHRVVAQGNLVIIFGRERTCVKPYNKIWESDFVLSFTFQENKISKFDCFYDSAALLKAYRGE